MKKITSVMMLAAAAAAALVSCNKEIEKPEVPQESEGIKVVINTGAPETKTYIEGTTPKWKATDAVGVFTGAAGANVKFTNTSADGAAAVFEGTVPASGTYYAYYPYSSATPNENGQYIQIPADQHPTPTSFDGATDILISEPIEINTTDATTVNTRFRRLGSFLKFVFTDGTTGKRLSGVTATKVSVIVDNTYGDGSYRPCPSVRVKPDGLGLRGSANKTISANYGDGVFELTADGNAVYLGILPQPFATGSSFDITITAGDATIKKKVTLKKDFELTSGRILPVPITLEDADYPEKVTKVEKLWSLVAPDSSTPWTTQYLGIGGENDRNVAIDGTNVYIAQFAIDATTKNLFAINIASTTSSAASYTKLPVGTVADGNIRAITCPRVIKKENGDPVLMVSELSSATSQKLYIYDNDGGINADPRVITLNKNGSSARLGDTFSYWGTYEKCMLFFHGMNGNGFLTFPFPSGLSAESAILTDRLNTSELTSLSGSGFASYHPFPDNINAGIAVNRSFGRYYHISLADGDLWSYTWGPRAVNNTQLVGLWETPNTNAGTEGENFVEFNGKRYVIYGCREEGFKTGYLVIKEGELSDDWVSIHNKNVANSFLIEKLTGNGKASGNGSGMDVAVWQDNDQLLIAIDMQDVGLAVYRMYAE